MTDISFPISEDFIELFKLLKIAGLCSSGGEAKHVISASLVTVDGVSELRKACKIRRGQRVCLNGQTIVVV
jgi:ribosome-associated protein